MSKLKLFLRGFAFIAIVLTIFPYIPLNTWVVRVFDFPHLQLTVLTVIAFLTYFFRFEIKNRIDQAFIISLLICITVQFQKIYTYTPLAAYEIHEGSKNAKTSISIYAANVLQKNKKKILLIKDAVDKEADVLLFTETDQSWIIKLNEHFSNTYKFKVEVPLDNTYGMLLYSKFELLNPKVKYIVEDTIPSIHTKLVLPSKDTIQVFAIHPAPPTPQHNPSSVDRDAEMMKIALMTRESEYPVIVMGDFNDVAWSETTKLFQRVSGLLDSRKGRGLYNTYNAKSYLMRWPLDHVFSSAAFRVKDIQVGDDIGSDHFPFFTEFTYEPRLSSEQELPKASAQEIKNAKSQIKEENS
ncbi:endonuclease/exonuclease/phosphatase family protein [uncultured Maribacter sp.]|uniref:endonuclease/exonuclease/phosphatase family protein n=1 Tax=uncultured Maribacter sp. TaxID=431308 RepID=UPI002631968B|nr:endonuclease/exonuclease/phosphatase family protein [uncultured Maribacter sp.]